jgi:F0F1-type ATP synthase membrane subunit b/b'
MADKDLGEELEKVEEGIENLKNKEFRLLGMKMTPTTIGALFAALASVFGMLYGGFVTYQKVEALAELDLDAVQAQMEKTSADVERIKADAQTIKDDLKDDIRDVKDKIDYVETKVDKRIQSFDEKVLGLETKVDTKMTRFEENVEKTKREFEDKLQKALDNPLAN